MDNSNSQREVFDAWWAKYGSAIFQRNEGWKVAFEAWKFAQSSGPEESECRRVLRLIATTPTTHEGKWIENCAAVFQQMAKTALENAVPGNGGQDSEPSASKEAPAGGRCPVAASEAGADDGDPKWRYR